MRLLSRIKIHQFKNWGHQMKKLACTLLLLLTSALVQAGFYEGLVAANKGDYQTAFKEWKPLAEQGDASVQYNLGVMYDKGQGVPQNDAQAVYWFKKAAEQGDAKAQYNLGVMYNKGQGIAQNYTQAVYWYQKAAEQGVAEAQYNLGVMYSNGQGVPQSYNQALYWYKKAAAQGVAEAQYNLALMYYKGHGVPQNYKIAYILFNLAASNGDADATKNRNIAAAKLSPATIEDAQRITLQLHNSKNFAADLRKLLNSQK